MFKRLEKEKNRSKHQINWNNLSFVYKNKKIFIHLEKEYPFKKPVFYINNCQHIEWFVKNYKFYNNFIRKFKIINPCICCNTILCDWVPTYNLDMIIDEYTLYYDKYEMLKKMYDFYSLELFDDLIYETIFLYLYI